MIHVDDDHIDAFIDAVMDMTKGKGSPVTSPMNTRHAEQFEMYKLGFDAGSKQRYSPNTKKQHIPYSEEEIKMRRYVDAAFKRGRELYVYKKDDTLFYRTKKSITLTHDVYTKYIGFFKDKEDAYKNLPQYL